MTEKTLQLLKFLEPSGTIIETLTQTSWGGHIPFIFCLMSYMRPRTYVELGTYHGASFFAVCQAIRDFKIDCSPTAVDLWLGDEHAGKYGGDVYKSFKRMLEDRYPGVGRILREDFTEAAANFGNHSLDLIHIDGLHTYEAVKNDYEIWLPKVSENGVILLHDTNVRERGFGVWKFWDEIKDNYTSFNFTHTHGLGMIALGSAASNPVVSLLQTINDSEASKMSFDNFFCLAGKRATREAISKKRLQAVPKLIINFLRPFRHNLRR